MSVQHLWDGSWAIVADVLDKFFVLTGSGGYSYLYEPLWWIGMITSELYLILYGRLLTIELEVALFLSNSDHLIYEFL